MEAEAGRFAQALDGCIQAGFEINKSVLVPERGAQLFSAYDFARMLKQLEEYLVGLILKLQFHAVLAQLSGSQIELEYAEAVEGRTTTSSGRKLALV